MVHRMERKCRSFIFGLIVILVDCLYVQAISTAKFFPFGDANLDNRLAHNDDGSSGELPISVSFPFFQAMYDSLYVNTNGAISFNENLEEFTPDAFPVGDGRRLIAPFWADVDTTNGGNVFYRESKNLEMLQRATSDVKRFFPRDFTSFQASWVFIATWNDVSHFMKIRHSARNPEAASTNTFQVILTTNGRHSFATFLYNKTEWTTGDASKGYNGEGGIPAQAGFNFGDGRRYYSIKGSRTSVVARLPFLTNVGVPGMFMFRIDEARIRKGGCNTAGSLTLSPRRGIVLGGTCISISGPCFDASDVVICRFNGNTTVEGNYENGYKASCVSPPLHKLGKIGLEVSLDNGVTYYHSTKFTSVALGRHGPEISGLASKDWTQHLNPLYLAWSPKDLKSKLVDIEVAKFDWNTLEILEDNIVVKKNVSNYGFHTIRDLVETAIPMPSTLENGAKRYLSPLAVVSIRAQTSKRGLPERIYSAPFLTIPYFNNLSVETNEAYRNINITRLCKIWFAQQDDKDLEKILNELIGCPGSVEQAEADSGRFTSDDFCKPPRTSSCMTYQNGSYHCFRSIFPSPSGAGQQCCYNREGRLIVGPSGGGTIDKYHAESSRFATLKHLKEDIYPWYLCCRLEKRCGLYYQKRPSENGTRYTPPQITTSFGDPHLITLDGFSYTFNGFGEYTMLQIEENGFMFQARMQPLSTSETSRSRGTFLTAFVLQDKNSDTVQIELNSLKLLDIFVNDEKETFDPKTSLLEFEDLILFRRNDSVIQVIFKSGIVVNVKQNDISLSFVMLLPKTFKGKTKGLLGVWDDNKKNDLTLPDGRKLSITLNDSQIHSQFGQKWLVDEAQSLFIYHEGKNYKDFVDRTYKPMLFEEVNSILVKNSLLKKAQNICGKVKECYFDIAATKMLKFGNTSKKEYEEFQKNKKDIKKVRVALYFNCAGERVSEQCDACGAGCRKGSNYTVIIILAVLFCAISAAVATILVLNYLYRHRRPEQPKVIGETKQPEAPKPRSEPTEMAFVLPPLPKQHLKAVNKD